MSDKTITGQIVKINTPEDISGGKYRKLVFAVKNDEGYEGKEQLFAFEIFEGADKDKINNFLKFNKVGQVVEVSYEIRCNENAGRYFTSLAAWKIFAAKKEAASQPDPIDTPIEDEPPF